MILFLTKAQPQLERIDPTHRFGRLVTPRHYSSVERTAETGRTWAADNDAFGTFHEERYLAMLDRIAGAPGCKFVTAPDVVGDAHATLALLEEWQPRIRAHGLPVALVAQDGLHEDDVAWDAIDALFIGGTTEWKMGTDARRIAGAALEHGKWLHMGRVNSTLRATYARAICCDSIDGTMVARFTDRYLERGILWTHLEQQLQIA